MVYNYPITRNRAVEAGVNLGHLNNFGTDQFDVANARGEVAYTWGDDVNRFRHGFALGQVNLDGSTFQDSIALNSSWQRVGSNGWYQSASASYTQIRYDTSSGASNALRDVEHDSQHPFFLTQFVVMTTAQSLPAGSFNLLATS